MHPQHLLQLTEAPRILLVYGSHRIHQAVHYILRHRIVRHIDICHVSARQKPLREIRQHRSVDLLAIATRRNTGAAR